VTTQETPAQQASTPDGFDPLEEHTLLREMVTLRSIGLLLLALVLAATFAALGQWQLQRATQNGTVVPTSIEHVKPLTAVATPQRGVHEAAVGQLVRVAGRFVAGDYLVVADRLNRGTSGYWVTGHLVTDAPAGAQLAVALGWTADRATAVAATAKLNDGIGTPSGALVGRYQVTDQPPTPTNTTTLHEIDAMAVPQLLNTWRSQTSGPVYNGYAISRTATAGLTVIDSPAPQSEVQLDLLNLFYAFEWALFALVAFYVWYRLVRDRWEERVHPEPEDDDASVDRSIA
jgi:surfeit locus 1 family protein